MEGSNLRDLGQALGIQPPWAIKSVNFDEHAKKIDVYLELQETKKSFAIFGGAKKHAQEELVSGAWRYMNVGSYHCLIHAKVPTSAAGDDNVISRALIDQLAFLGHPSRHYSNYLRQQVALAQIKGVDLATISDLYNLSDATLKAIAHDLNTMPAETKPLAHLPTEMDPVWDRILNDQQHLKTNILPLKFLLSKIKLSAVKDNSAAGQLALKQELRKFFTENTSQLDNEIEQLCGITSQKLKQRARAVSSKQRLVLPSLKSPVWLDLLSGRLNLNSLSVPLNLLISRQRTAFVQGHTKEAKIQAIDTLRDYVRQNYRTLKPELVLINRAMNIRNKTAVSLPDPEHQVWQKILEDEQFIPSEHIAYKLLLAKLRAQVTSKPEPVVRLEAARRIRDFLKHNKNAMRQELGALLKQASAV